MSGRILACGGGGAFDSFLLGLAASRRPKVCFLPTAVADEQAAVVGFYERFVPLACEPYQVANGDLPPGVACDDAVAALYDGTELEEIVATSPDASAYRVTASGEEPLPARLLAG